MDMNVGRIHPPSMTSVLRCLSAKVEIYHCNHHSITEHHLSHYNTIQLPKYIHKYTHSLTHPSVSTCIMGPGVASRAYAQELLSFINASPTRASLHFPRSGCLLGCLRSLTLWHQIPSCLSTHLSFTAATKELKSFPYSSISRSQECTNPSRKGWIHRN